MFETLLLIVVTSSTAALIASKTDLMPEGIAPIASPTALIDEAALFPGSSGGGGAEAVVGWFCVLSLMAAPEPF
jgi:hypothetical protein